jgi:hypothetical protein
MSSDFVFSLEKNADTICGLVQMVADAGAASGFIAFRDQVKLYPGNFVGCEQLQGFDPSFSAEINPKLSVFSADLDLAQINLREQTPAELTMHVDLQRKPFESIPQEPATHKLHLNFEAVDTEEIKNLSVSFDGTSGIFKLGEGEANHYQIPNDKKLWESQLMIVCRDGKYYVRDLGVVHTSRIKIDKTTEVQIQQDALVDLGKVVHYHFDKVTHKEAPTA